MRVFLKISIIRAQLERFVWLHSFVGGYTARCLELFQYKSSEIYLSTLVPARGFVMIES